METLGFLYGLASYEAAGEAIAPPSVAGRSAAWSESACPSNGRSPAALLQLWLILGSASLLLVGTAPVAVADHLLRFGSQGVAVQQLQQQLAIAGYFNGPVTGYYGELTQTAVRRFQQAQGLGVDGIVGPQTRAALQQSGGSLATSQFAPSQIYYTTPPTLTPAIAQPPRATNALYVGDSGPAVFQLQQSLQAIGYYGGPITGYFGPQTEAAILEFQRRNGLRADGVVGLQTQGAIAQFASFQPVNQPMIQPGVQPAFQPVNQPARQPIVSNQTAAVSQAATTQSITVPAATVIPPVPSQLGEVLYRGDSGPTVSQIQTDLQRFGYYNGPITGYYGPLTEDAVADFQADNDLIVTGIAGPKTVNALRNSVVDLG